MRKVTFHEDATFEISEAARYYENSAPELGLAFLDEIEKTIRRIMENPCACQLVGEEIRQALVARFPYSILYIVEPDNCIRIVAVAHHKRRPGYWGERSQ
jgi:toxin ParE1/3/4